MKIRNNHSEAGRLRLWIGVALISLLLFSSAVFCKERQTAPDNMKKLHISADRLTANQNKRHVVFSGHVITLYESAKITSDKLQVFVSDQADTSLISDANVQEIIASGNVQIEMDGKTAQCDKATFNPGKNTLTLTGPESRLQSKTSYITGDKMIFYQDTGEIVVHGNHNQRVNAVFQPEAKESISNQK